MGSYGIPGESGTHAQIDRELMTRAEFGGVAVTRTDCRLVNFNHHYNIRRENGVPVAIELSLISRYRECNAPGKERASEWVYKPMDETMGPCEVDCPLSLLDMVPCPDSDYARKWREEVREFHSKGSASRAVIAPGDVVTTTYGANLTITRLQKRTLVYRSEKDGREYALPRKFIESVCFRFPRPEGERR
jgi:hypothetical protein